MLLAVAVHIRGLPLSFRGKSWCELTGAPVLKNNLVYKMKWRERERVGGREGGRGYATDNVHFKRNRMALISSLRVSMNIGFFTYSILNDNLPPTRSLISKTPNLM